MISIIAAIGKNNELGKNNDLIWHLKKDLKNFKELTMNKKIVMGTNTYKSLPKKLEGRSYVILSTSLNDIDGALIYNNFADLLKYLQSLDEEVMIIGGASIYKMFLPYADNLYLTEINAEASADVYFPSFDKSLYSKSVLEEITDEEIKYNFVLYKKVK